MQLFDIRDHKKTERGGGRMPPPRSVLGGRISAIPFVWVSDVKKIHRGPPDPQKPPSLQPTSGHFHDIGSQGGLALDSEFLLNF